MGEYKIMAVKCDGCHKHSTENGMEFSHKWLSVDVDGVFYNLCPECIETRTNLRNIIEGKGENDGISKSIDDN